MLDTIVDLLREHAVVLLRVFYLAASALILFINAVPPLNRRFLSYGARDHHSSALPGGAGKPQRLDVSSAEKPQAGSLCDQLLDYLATFRVPHRFFFHFYLVSLMSQVLWQRYGASHIINVSQGVQVAWVHMLFQGLRRLAESLIFMSKSKSTMWFGHYVLGLLFYLTVTVAIWIEEPTPPMREQLLSLSVLVCQGLQFSFHEHLHHLRQEGTYQIPKFRFSSLLCPHYTCEVLIYLHLSILAAPPGRLVNFTLLTATLMVGVNLAVTASGTKLWYEQRFGVDSVRGSKRMVPGLW
ncbi:3-oxo-5-alpha-steroid 4-dehydrogenase-like protein [Sporormia fimetaria CBS 119925]|uniref:Polyprenal reductase n=1 Tax=Sporormia fimetaria CBS 119925 TaxID=1340428 RepID=A0A6A6V3U8_9PLEO|nr:3-oxo-5-alpha-steroid 4-dehydrogenase-like protein [Sporormia fimetaria CBS 119925]